MKRLGRIIVGLHTGSVRIRVVRNGAAVTSVCIRLDETPGPEAWDDGLRPYDEALREAMRRCSVEPGSSVDVLYDSPTAAISAGPIELGGRAGAGAALLELESRSAIDLEAQPHSAWVHEGHDGQRPTCVALTDHPVTLESVALWLERSGVRLASAVPSEAVGIMCAVQMRELQEGSSPAQLSMYLGRWTSGIVVSSSEGVRFARSSPLTLDALVQALITTDQSRSTHEQIEQALQRLGPPSENDRDGHELRASIQPLLHRATVDIRQCMRFGVDKESLEQLTMVVGGEGARFPGITGLLSEHLGVEQRDAESFDAETRVIETIDRLGLTSAALLGTTRQHTLRRSIWVGAAVGLGVCVAQWLGISADLSNAQDTLDHLRDGASGVSTIREQEHSIEQREALVHRIASAASRTTGFGPRWPGLLVDLSERRPARVLLQSLSSARTQDNAGHVEITGSVLPAGLDRSDDERTPSEVLQDFIASLVASPLIDTVELGSTSRGGSYGEDTTNFSLSVRLHPAPSMLAEVDHDG